MARSYTAGCSSHSGGRSPREKNPRAIDEDCGQVTLESRTTRSASSSGAEKSAFSLEKTSYGALAVFSLWFGLGSFLIQPLTNALSRRHEFAADAFALRSGATADELGSALRKLRETSRLLPLSHPLYSRVYHSHPPLLERLRAME